MTTTTDIVPPDWVPTDARVTFLDGKNATVESKGVSTLAFGAVPAGWKVTVLDRGHLAKITATKVGKTATLILTGSFSRDLIIDAPFHTIELGAAVQLNGAIRPTTDDVTIVYGGPGLTISLRGAAADSSVLGYRFRGRPENRSGAVALAGDMVLRELSGDDLNVRVLGPTAQGSDWENRHSLADGATGKVEFKEAVRFATICSPNLQVTAGAVLNCSIEAIALDVGGEVRASSIKATWFSAPSVDGSTIVVDSTEPGPALSVGMLRDKRAREPIALDFNGDGGVNPPNILGAFGPATGSTLTCTGPGDIHVGETEKTLLSSGAGIAVYRSFQQGRLDDRQVAIQAAKDLYISGDLALADGETASAAQMYVRGTSIGGSFTGTNAILHGDVKDFVAKVTEFRSGGNLANTCLDAQVVVLQPSATVDAQSRLLIRGTGTTLPKDFDGELRWEGSGVLTLAGAPAVVQVTAPEGKRANLKLANPEFVLPELVIRRIATIHTEGKSEGAATISRLVFDDTAGLVTARFAGTGVSLGQVEDSPGAVLEHHGTGPMHVSLNQCRHLTLRPAAGTQVHATSTDDDVTFVLSGQGQVELSGKVARIDCPAANRATKVDEVPILAVTASGAVQHLTGGVRLGRVQGRITGQPTARQGWRRLWPWAKPEGCSPLIFDIAPQAGRAEESGYVIDVDPTPTSFYRLLNVEDFHVFEPSAPALIDWARSVGRSGTGDDKRDAAYKAKRIADQVKKTASSGSARATANWAAAHTHHMALRHAPVENLFRWVHRALGYSYRPGPPLTIYLSVVLVTAAITWKAQLASGHWKDIGGVGAIALRVATLPVSWLLKLPTEDDTLLFTTDWMNPVVFFLAGFPLVFFVVALRHFLSPPSD